MHTSELFPLSSEQPRRKNVQQLFAYYARYWYLFLAGAVLALLTAYAYLQYYATPQYVISSTLLVKEDNPGSDLVAGASLSGTGLLRSSKNLNNEIEVLKSISLMERVVAEMYLFVTYFTKEKVKNVELYGESSPVRLVIHRMDSAGFNRTISVFLKANNNFELHDAGHVATYQLGRPITRPYGSFTLLSTGRALPAAVADKELLIKFSSVATAAENFRNVLAIAPVNKEASILKASLTDAIPARGRDVLNKLIEVYNKEALEDKNLTASNTIEFLDDRLKYLTAELTTVEKDVEKYKRLNEVTDVSTQATSYLEQASDYNKKISEWAIQTDILESIERYLNKSDGQYKMVPSTLGLQDQTLLGLIESFNKLQIERERMLRTTEPGNPLVQNLNEQLGNLRMNILENLRNIKRGLSITSANLKSNSGQFRTRIQNIPSMERELLQINRQQETKQKLYLYLLQKREEAALTLAATVSNSRILDPAMSDNLPISPNKQIIYLVALLIGLGLPFGLVYVRQAFDDKVKTQQDVADITSTPILGEIANNPYETLVVTETNHSPIAEMFRLLRSNLHFASAGQENKVVLITSSMSGEGKTFFAINLGASLVLTGKRVVLLELDLRNPNLALGLDMPHGPGITNYLVSDRVAIEDIVRPCGKVPGLSVVSSGPIPPNPAELMMSQKLAHLITELREAFDYVLIDTPPIGQVADAFTLSHLADSSLYLVRYNYTHKKQLYIIDDIYRKRMLRHPMIVLNDARKENEYGYGYGYGYDVKKKGKIALQIPI